MMIDPFRRNRGDNQNDDDSPRIVFANLSRLERPLLTEKTYRVFVGTAVSAWALLVFFVWIFRIEIKLSPDLISDLAASSVDLSALSIAVLAILHELNKKQKWFKLGLLLVAILFAGVVFGGFFLALTWKEAFGLPQQITVVVVIALGIIAVFQIDWKVVLERVRRTSNDGAEPKAVAAIRLLGLVVPFFLPIILVWLPGLNRLTGVVVTFAGGLLALIALMAVTTISVFRFKEIELEDPFLTALRARYERETKWLVRLGELREIGIKALESLEPEQINAAKHATEDEKAAGPQMIDTKAIIDRVRQMGVTEGKNVLDDVVYSLVNEGRIYRESSSYWRVPDEDVFRESVAQLEKLALVISATDTSSSDECIVEGFRLTNFRNWLAVALQMPGPVVGEYIVPRLLKLLRDEKHFHLLLRNSYSIFINRKGPISPSEWQNIVDHAQATAQDRVQFYKSYGGLDYSEEESLKRFTWDYLLKNVPHTDDGPTFGLDQENFKALGSILLEHD
jgi:hypothetical protein